MKKFIAIILISAFATVLLMGCGGAETFDSGKSISVISREDGSGTRGAFIELFGIEEKNDAGNRKDTTTKRAIIADKTDIMMSNVVNNPHAIGYLSLGSLNDTVRGVSIDGVAATSENVKNGTYKIARPFKIAIKGEVEGVVKDFIDFILSKEGQEVVGKDYITIDDNSPSYSGNNSSGKITITGSSSVSPIMDKLREEYLKLNTNAEIELNTTDSTAGMNSVIEGTCDIGMASRDLKDSEKEQLTDITIALDGIAVIVNTKNEISALTSEQVKNIFTGAFTKWSDVIQ